MSEGEVRGRYAVVMMAESHDVPDVLLATDLPLAGKRVGKVRDVYDGAMNNGEPVVVLVATDRLSAFDVVLPDGIPGKGRVLTQTAAFWFGLIAQHFGEAMPHHLISTDPRDLAGLDEAQRLMLAGRVMIGRRTEVVPIECVARGYLAGSGWTQYQKDGTVCGVELPAGLTRCAKLPAPIFTPSTKAAEGHDENISFEQACDLVGGDLMQALRERTLSVYRFGHDYAAQRGILLADTKLEFGIAEGSAEGSPILIDEVLTPDSSRFWPADQYASGRDQPSFDKQFVRNHLESLVTKGQWNKQSPGPCLPEEIIAQTAARYDEAMKRLGVMAGG